MLALWRRAAGVAAALVLSACAATACSGSAGGAADGGGGGGDGAAADAGHADGVGGGGGDAARDLASDKPAGCVAGGACPTLGCAQLAGDYRTCIKCGAQAWRDLYPASVVQTCGCKLSITLAAGPMPLAQPGCAAVGGGASWDFDQDNLTGSCSGTPVAGGMDFTCGFASGTCSVSWRAPGSTCP